MRGLAWAQTQKQAKAAEHVCSKVSRTLEEVLHVWRGWLLPRTYACGAHK